MGYASFPLRYRARLCSFLRITDNKRLSGGDPQRLPINALAVTRSHDGFAEYVRAEYAAAEYTTAEHALTVSDTEAQHPGSEHTRAPEPLRRAGKSVELQLLRPRVDD